jgi:hypothetical protein
VTEPGQPLGARERRQGPVQGGRQHLAGVGVHHVVHPALALGELGQPSTDQRLPPRRPARVSRLDRPSSPRMPAGDAEPKGSVSLPERFRVGSQPSRSKQMRTPCSLLAGLILGPPTLVTGGRQAGLPTSSGMSPPLQPCCLVRLPAHRPTHTTAPDPWLTAPSVGCRPRRAGHRARRRVGDAEWASCPGPRRAESLMAAVAQQRPTGRQDEPDQRQRCDRPAPSL